MSAELTEGQDSFLDIIANLVGVLIILVVIVGAQATSAFVGEPEVVQTLEAEETFEQREKELRSRLSVATSQANKVRLDRAKLQQQTVKEKLLAQDLATQRHVMLMQLEIVRGQHEANKQQRQKNLDDQQKEQLARQTEKIQLVSQLENINKEINAVSATRIESVVETIDHYPNPIAKTVFSQEVHFRLDKGRITYVPMDELIEQMKSEIKLKAEKLKQANVTRETVGPYEGFRLQYELGVVPQSETGLASSRIVRFNRFILQPVDPNGGELLKDALDDNSIFSAILNRMEPRSTTVSVWVYPNSYGEYSDLKKWLHERGFQMASWPLAEGRPISGGPDGFRTSAQ